MLRSMYAGISGMKANQTKMDVVGNNVANVGTTAYKKTNTRFADALYQTSIYASAPSGGIGGVNPGQVGIGTEVSGIFRNMVQGAIQPTGRPTDLAMDGDGFFTVQIAENQYAYTRDGSFSIDKDGYLVTADGYKVVGEKIDADGNIVPGEDGNNLTPIKVPETIEFAEVEVNIAAEGEDQNLVTVQVPVNDETITIGDDGNIKINAGASVSIDGKEYPITDANLTENKEPITKKVLSFNISQDGKISYLLNDGTKVPQLDPDGELSAGATQQQLKIGVFQNPEGLEALGGNLFGTSANSGDPIDTDVFGRINQGAIEMSNVDLSEEFTEMIVTTRAFQAASKVITTSDELLQEIINLKR